MDDNLFFVIDEVDRILEANFEQELKQILKIVLMNCSRRRQLSEGDKKRSKRQPKSKSYTVKINYATKIPIQANINALRGQEPEQFYGNMSSRLETTNDTACEK